MHKDIQKLIDIARQSGVLTDRQREIILNKSKILGEDLDEVEIILESICPAQKDQVANNKGTQSISEELVKTDETSILDSNFGPSRSSFINRCPNCGATLPGRVSQCPECGYVFYSVSTSPSIIKLSNELKNTSSLKRRKRLIESFVTPNTKSELLDFIIFVKPHVLDYEDKTRLSYQKKYLESIDKCKKYFPNNGEVQTYLNEYEHIKDRIKKDRRSRAFKSLIWRIPLLVLFLVGFYEGFRYLQRRNYNDRLNSLEFLTKSLDNNDFQSVRLSLNSMLSNDGMTDYSQIAKELTNHAQKSVNQNERASADTLISMLYSLPDGSFDERAVHHLLYDLAELHNEYFEINPFYDVLQYFPTNDPNMLSFMLTESVKDNLFRGMMDAAKEEVANVNLYLSNMPVSVKAEVRK